MIFEMRQLATRITPNLGNHNQKIDRTTVQFSSVLWIFLVHRTEPVNTKGPMCSRSMADSLISLDHCSLPPMGVLHMLSCISMILQMLSIIVWDIRLTTLFIVEQCSSFRICSGVNILGFNRIRHMHSHGTWVQTKTVILLFILTDPVIVVATIFQQLHQMRLQ